MISEHNLKLSHPLQSREWGEFRKAWGNEVLFTEWGVITLHKIPFTSFKIGMFIKCPVPTSEMLSDLKNLSQKHNLIFIKLEPSYVKTVDGQKEYEGIINLLKTNGCEEGKTLFTPTSFWIDLTPTEEIIFKSFNTKTRYNIRLAQKHGVRVQIDNSDTMFEKYLELTFETAKRQGFYAHSPNYHHLMWEYLHEKLKADDILPMAHLLTATYNNEVISTWILFTYKDFLYYPYGASSDKYRNVMANNLMMWEAIRFGKKMGLKTFDLWGREEGKGFTKFKEGYNPQVVEFLGSWDFVINKPLYEIYRIAEVLRWKILKLKGKLTK